MGGVQSTMSDGYVSTQDSAEHLLGEFIGGKLYPLGSKQWQQLFELPLDRRWQSDHMDRACKCTNQLEELWKITFGRWNSLENEVLTVSNQDI